MKLTVKERETLAKRIVQQINQINLEKLSKRFEGNADFIALKKQFAEEQRAQQKAFELNKKFHEKRKAFNTKHKLKEVALFVDVRVNPHTLKFRRDSYGNDWQFRQNMEDEIILEGLQQDGDIKKVMEVLIKRFTV
jgi:DNA-directed RNA polymerase